MSTKLKLVQSPSSGFPHQAVQGSPVLDERLPGLLLDALAPIEAAIASAMTGAPYTIVRGAMDLGEDHRSKLLHAAQAAVAAHSDGFAEHRSAIEFVLGLTAINAGQMDTLLTLLDAEQVGAGQPAKPCSTRDAAVIGLIVLAPVLLLAGFIFYKFIKEG